MRLVTPFDPFKSGACSCPPKYSACAYAGCSHGCLYCYASSYIRGFAQPRPKTDFLKKFKKDIASLPDRCLLTMANSSDPYCSLEKKQMLTRSALKILLGRTIKILLVTKSPLVLRDKDIIKELTFCVVCISLTTTDTALAKRLEPHAACPRERLKTVEQLSKDIPVAVRLDPLIYPITTATIKKNVRLIKDAGARQIITSTYKIKPDNFKRMCSAFPECHALWRKEYFKEGAHRGGYRYLPFSLREKLIREARAVTLKEGMSFSSCREQLSELNTAACDGSSLFAATGNTR